MNGTPTNFMTVTVLSPAVECIPGVDNPLPNSEELTSEELTKVTKVAVINISNLLNRVNGFTLTATCDHPNWKPEWAKIFVLTPSVLGEDDEIAPDNSKALLRFAAKRERKVMIQFVLPRIPEARAGAYKFSVQIEANYISETENGGAYEQRVRTVTGTLNVRPFYEWDVVLVPEGKAPKKKPTQAGVRVAAQQTQMHMGIFRRRIAYDIHVRNAGNDWLYCELQGIPGPELVLEYLAERVAIPPAGDYDTLPRLALDDKEYEAKKGCQRIFPLKAQTTLGKLRGTETQLNFTFEAKRLDAPSLSHRLGEQGYQPHGNVLVIKTPSPRDAANNNIKNLETQTFGFEYRPLIPSGFWQVLGKPFAWIRANVATFIGLCLLIPVTLFIWRSWAYQTFRLKSLSGYNDKRTVELRGQLIRGASLFFTGQIDGKEYKNIPLDSSPSNKDRFGSTEQTVNVTFPKDPFEGAQQIKGSVYAIHKLLFFDMPIPKMETPFSYGGTPVKPEIPVKSFAAGVNQKYKVEIKNADSATVIDVENRPVSGAKWLGDGLLMPGLPIAQPYQFTITPIVKGKPGESAVIQVTVTPPVPPAIPLPSGLETTIPTPPGRDTSKMTVQNANTGEAAPFMRGSNGELIVAPGAGKRPTGVAPIEKFIVVDQNGEVVTRAAYRPTGPVPAANLETADDAYIALMEAVETTPGDQQIPKPALDAAEKSVRGFKLRHPVRLLMAGIVYRLQKNQEEKATLWLNTAVQMFEADAAQPNVWKARAYRELAMVEKGVASSNHLKQAVELNPEWSRASYDYVVSLFDLCAGGNTDYCAAVRKEFDTRRADIESYLRLKNKEREFQSLESEVNKVSPQ